jgi:hypothetical protein
MPMHVCSAYGACMPPDMPQICHLNLDCTQCRCGITAAKWAQETSDSVIFRCHRWVSQNARHNGQQDLCPGARDCPQVLLQGHKVPLRLPEAQRAAEKAGRIPLHTGTKFTHGIWAWVCDTFAVCVTQMCRVRHVIQLCDMCIIYVMRHVWQVMWDVWLICFLTWVRACVTHLKWVTHMCHDHVSHN